MVSQQHPKASGTAAARLQKKVAFAVWRFLPRLRKRLAPLNTVGSYCPRRVCLITGPPRSGTSAVVKWLEQQEGVKALNESRTLVAAHGMMHEVRRFKKLASRKDQLAEGVRRAVLAHYAEITHYTHPPTLIDKEPLEPIAFPDRDYSGFIASVRTVFPDLKLLFLVRDPVSTIWSMTQREWGYSLLGEEPRTFSLEEHIENWCACVDIVLASVAEENTYVCQYGALTSDPNRESDRIGQFFGLPNLSPFEPRPSDESAFSADSLALVEAETRSRVEALTAAGFDQL